MTESPVPGTVPRFELAEWRRHGVVAGITGRGTPGRPFDLGLGGAATPTGASRDNWRDLLACFPGFRGATLSRQVHGREINWGDPEQIAGLVVQPGFDGHAAESPGILLTVTVADCIPVYLVDPERRLALLIHAGWRGTAAGILPLAIQQMADRGAVVDNLLMHCGVGICGECYEVGREVFEACRLTPPDPGRGRLDLRKVLEDQGRSAGVSHISSSSHCSAHHRERFFSHRASGGGDGRMVAYLGLVA